MLTLSSAISLIFTAASASSAGLNPEICGSLEAVAPEDPDNPIHMLFAFDAQYSSYLRWRRVLPEEAAFADLVERMLVYECGIKIYDEIKEPGERLKETSKEIKEARRKIVKVRGQIKETRGQRKDILSYIRRAAGACSASGYVFAAFTALAMYNHGSFLEPVKNMRKNNRDRGMRGLLHAFSCSEFNAECSEIRGKPVEEYSMDDFSAISILVEFSLFTKKLEPASDCKTFRAILERLYGEAFAPENDDAVNKKLTEKVSCFNSLANRVLGCPSSR
ncbi:hypothetical protein PAPHI01_0159 [Pancytospora philotis]|nr:hypothetical protein PAPHI01_0159 [Pancytospora philotis]